GGEGGADARAAFATLRSCLVTVAGLLAPFTPFVADAIWRNLAAGRDGAPDSVHLSDYPLPHDAQLDDALEAAMADARAIVELGRRVRTDAKVRVRQPLARAVVRGLRHAPALDALLPLVAEELNVREVVLAAAEAGVGAVRAKPDFRVLGRRLGPAVRSVAEALAADDGTLAARLAAGERVTIAAEGGAVEIGPDEVELVQVGREGWGSASDGALAVELELALDDDLRREGLAREVIRVVQDARKAAGLEVGDRIVLGLGAVGDLAAAIDAHRATIAGEVLATSVSDVALDAPAHAEDATVEGSALAVSLRRA
ncbi:MAG: DUF5915 domain-containing protein, partial [Actinomycetota bacterium]